MIGVIALRNGVGLGHVLAGLRLSVPLIRGAVVDLAGGIHPDETGSTAGGLLYSFGVIFHAWQRLRFQNAIWHGFVLLGAACHYTAVLDLILA